MSWSDSRFHAIANDLDHGSFIFARLRYPTLEILDAEKAYEALASNPRAKIAGCANSPTKQLMSLLLSIPKSSARVSAGELELRCMDKSSVELLVSLPIKPVPAKPLLHALHSCLMLASASIEGALLEIVGADMRTNIVEATPESLDVLHGPLLAGGQPVQLRSSFRRVAAADTRLHAARAFAVAQSAEKVREEILNKRKERQDEKRKKRQRERERIREVEKLIGYAAKRTKPSLFDVENDSENEEKSERKTEGDKAKLADVQVARAPPVATTTSAQTEAKEANSPKETAKASLSSGNNTQAERHEGPQRTATQSAGRKIDEPAQRKKKRKVRKLV